MDQPKLERLLRLMKLLTANTTYNIDQLAERLQMSRRTVYRYIDTFRDAGFVIKKSGEHIRLDKESPHFKDISQLVHFTEEEAVILKSAIENIDDTNLLKQNLKRKLYSVYDNKTLADTIVKGRLSGIVHNLVGAIAEKRQVVLQAYRSARGAAVRDRRVEPFAFTTNYVNIWCYDTEDGLCKLFKTSRIKLQYAGAQPFCYICITHKTSNIMKINTITTLGMLCMALAARSCCRQAPETTGTLPTAAAVVLQDYGRNRPS